MMPWSHAYRTDKENIEFKIKSENSKIITFRAAWNLQND
jgi:hypothetical protein